MVSLTQDSKGNYRARKRLPDDVRDHYGDLHGPRVEAKFFAPASTKRHEAERQFDEWKAEIICGLLPSGQNAKAKGYR